MNTIVSLAVAIYLDFENLDLQRLGTHDIELFFGFMRIISSFNRMILNVYIQ